MPKITTIKLPDKLDNKLTQVRAEINKALSPRVVKRNEIMILALQKFLKSRTYKRAYKIETKLSDK